MARRATGVQGRQLTPAAAPVAEPGAESAAPPDADGPGEAPALYEQPGHLIRRAHQIAVSMFLESLGREVTPVQYALLRLLQDRPGIDQVTLAAAVALDTSTTADIAARLEAKGWIVREVLPRRQRALSLTAEGQAVLARLSPGLRQMQGRLLGGLAEAEQHEFMRLLRKFVDLNNDQSRAPLRG